MRLRPVALALLGTALLLALPPGSPVQGQPQGTASAAPSAAPPRAFDVLAQMRAAYAGLSSYRDHGDIEVSGAPGAPAPPPRRFETVASAGGGFRFTLETGSGLGARREVLWGGAGGNQGGGVQHYDSGREAVRPAPSWLAELVTLLGEGSLDALLVPALLAGGAEALPDPSAATVEGPVPCDGAICWVLAMTPFGGGIESRLWVDRDSHLLHRLEVRPVAAGDLPPGLAPPRPALVRVFYKVDAVGAPVSAADLAFAPPAGTRRVVGWSDAPLPKPTRTPAGAPAAEGEASFGEVVDVSIFSLAVRALDEAGNPIRDLKPEDFKASLDGLEVPVAAADWFSTAGPGTAAAGEAGAPAESTPGPESRGARKLPPSEPGVWPPEPPLPDEGQLVVVFVQADINAPSRTRGQLKTLPYAHDVLDTLKPADRVAVVSFDSHLKLWQDFTRDHDAAFAAVGRAIRFGGKPPPEALSGRREPRSLARHFDAGAAKAAASPEQALQVLGDALAPLPGEKLMIYLGWGLGEYIGGVGTRMTRDYGPALQALGAARATVFVLDITDASSHSLEVGLEKVAKATGGTYSKTVDFPAQAAIHLARVISGYYVLSFDDDLLRAGGTLSLQLRNRKGRLLYRPVVIR